MVKSTFFSRFQEWISEWDETKTRQVLVVLLAVLCGLLVGLVIDLFARVVLEFIFYPPVSAGLADKADLPDIYNKYGLQIFSTKILAWALGTLAGGYTAVRMAKKGQFPAWIVGILLFAAYLIGMLSLPTPLWVLLLAPVLVAVCAYGAGWLGMYVTSQKTQQAEARA